MLDPWNIIYILFVFSYCTSEEASFGWTLSEESEQTRRCPPRPLRLTSDFSFLRMDWCRSVDKVFKCSFSAAQRRPPSAYVCMYARRLFYAALLRRFCCCRCILHLCFSASSRLHRVGGWDAVNQPVCYYTGQIALLCPQTCSSGASCRAFTHIFLSRRRILNGSNHERRASASISAHSVAL